MKLDEIEKLIANASPEPWTIDPRSLQFFPNGSDSPPCFDIEWVDDGLGAEIDGLAEPHRGSFTIPDAKFIAASRKLLPKLLAVAKAASNMGQLKKNDLYYPEYLKLVEALKALERD
jgi:hypothetical protein